MPTNNTTEAQILRFTQRVSWAKKKANNFKWAEDMADYYDLAGGIDTNNDRINRLRFNYSLYRGDGDEAMLDWSYSDTPDILADEGISLTDFENIRHHDIISPIVKELLGEQIKRPFSPMAQDSSEYTMNQRKRKQNELFQQYLVEAVVIPLEQQVTQGYFLQNNITDPFSLSPEEQQQAQSDIQKRVEAMTPPEIVDFMRKDYKSPAEIQAQRIIEYLTQELDLKYLFDEGFKHALITGEEIYRLGVRHNEPFVDLVNPIGFMCEAADGKFFIEDGAWAKYEEFVPAPDIYEEFGDQLTSSELKRLDGLLVPGNAGDYDNVTRRVEAELVAKISKSGNRQAVEQIDAKRKSGQDQLIEMRRRLVGTNPAFSFIRKCHLAWASARKLRLVTRVLQNGKVMQFYQDESYRFDPLKGDVEIRDIWTKQMFETTKLGYTEAVYTQKRALPWQYPSVNKPWGVKLPYYGVYYGKLMGNAENVAQIDLGKPWQFKFNRVLAKIEEIETFDIGKVLMVWDAIRPEGWSWGKWLMMMKYGHIVPASLEDATTTDLQAIRSFDLGTIFDIQAHLNYLEFLRNQAAIVMGVNPSRLGQISPYLTTTNNQQNILQSVNQTEHLFRAHNKVEENVLNALVGAARIAWKKNPPKKSFILNDMSIAELDLDWEMLDRSEIGVFIRTSGGDLRNMEVIKEQAQSMIQNDLITFPEMVGLQFASSPAEVINLADKAEERKQKMQQAMMEAQKQEAELERQLQLSLKDKEDRLRLMMQDKELASQERRTDVDSTKFEKQYDINKDGVNDSIEKGRMELAVKSDIENRKLDIEEKKLKEEIKIEKEKLKIEREKIKKMGSKPK